MKMIILLLVTKCIELKQHQVGSKILSNSLMLSLSYFGFYSLTHKNFKILFPKAALEWLSASLRKVLTNCFIKCMNKHFIVYCSWLWIPSLLVQAQPEPTVTKFASSSQAWANGRQGHRTRPKMNGRATFKIKIFKPKTQKYGGKLEPSVFVKMLDRSVVDLRLMLTDNARAHAEPYAAAAHTATQLHEPGVRLRPGLASAVHTQHRHDHHRDVLCLP